MSATRPDPAPQFRVTCADCPSYDPDPTYSRPTASWEAEFHDELIHQDGEEHAEVKEV